MRISVWSSDWCASDLLLQGDRIGDHVPVKQLQYGFVNAPMHGFEEMLGAQPYLHILSDAVVDHQRAQQGGFRLDIARQAFFRRVLRGNQSYILGHVLSSAHCAKETRDRKSTRLNSRH